MGWLLLLSLLSILNCSRDYPIFEIKGGRFPLSVGNWWKLSREWESVIHPSLPPWEHHMTGLDSVYWEIIERDILCGYRSFVLKNEYTEEGGGHFLTFDWYTDFWDGWDGLYQIGYAGAGELPPEPFPGYRFRFAEKEFGSPSQILWWICGTTLGPADTTLRIPPRKVLVYPRRIGEEWVAFDDPWLQVRQLVGWENVRTPRGAFACWKIQVLSDYDGDGEWNEDIIWYDWFANEGLIKRHLWSTGDVTDPWGNPVGTWEGTQIWLLEDYSIL